MKKIIFTIIMIFFIFSNNVFAKEGLLEKTLDLNYWPESFKLNLETLKTKKFKNKQLNNIFYKIKNIDTILRKTFITKYRKKQFSYYQMNDIVRDYNYFIFHTNKFFYYYDLKEKFWNDGEINDAILEHYTLARQYFYEIKNDLK